MNRIPYWDNVLLQYSSHGNLLCPSRCLPITLRTVVHARQPRSSNFSFIFFSASRCFGCISPAFCNMDQVSLLIMCFRWKLLSIFTFISVDTLINLHKRFIHLSVILLNLFILSDVISYPDLTLSEIWERDYLDSCSSAIEVTDRRWKKLSSNTFEIIWLGVPYVATYIF